jgi:alpha-tubulin suppressor-like RCC1 family protein
VIRAALACDDTHDHGRTLAGLTAIAISCGYYHTCAIVTGGGVMCWGYNGDGQLGIGSTSQQTIPVAVYLGIGGCLVSHGRT